MSDWEKFKKEHGIHDYTEIVCCEKSIQEYIRALLEEELRSSIKAPKIIQIAKSQCADELEELKTKTCSCKGMNWDINNLIKKWRKL